MRPKHTYLALCVLGTVLPYWQLIPFLRTNGIDVRLMIQQLFVNPVAAFFGVDVIVSTLVLWALIAIEGRRHDVRNRWLPVLASLTVGVSLGLPLFLYMKEARLEQQLRDPRLG